MNDAAGIASVLLAWRLTEPFHRPTAGATAEQFVEAERAVGRRLCDDLRSLYAASDGGEFLWGNLMLEPLFPPTDDPTMLALTTASSQLRSSGWPIPESLLVFGSDGTDDLFGLWIPRDGRQRRWRVVQIGAVFEQRCMAVVGDDLASFLRGWTAYYLLLHRDEMDTREALLTLGVPADLRSLAGDGTEEEFFAVLRWASAGLPDPEPDPYERGLAPEDLDALAD